MSVIHIKNNEEYQTQLAESKKGKLVVVDFSAEWCGPCKRIAPTYEELAKKHTEAIFLHIDIDECKDIPDVQNVSGVPTFRFYKNGEKISEFSGASVAKLTSTVEENL